MQEHARAILGLNVSPFVAGATKARKVTKGLGKDLRSALGFFGVGFAVSALGRSIGRFADDLINTSRKLGVSTDFLQAWNFQANQIGVSTNAANMGLQRFTRRIGEAARGQGVLAKVIEESNIQLRDSQGNMRSTTDILADYADVIQNAESQQERLRLAFQAFDSEGAALVTMLQNGSEGLRRMMRDAEEMGAVVERRSITSINRLTNRLRTLSTQGLGWATEKAGKFLQMLEAGGAGLGVLFSGGSIQEMREIVQAQIAVQDQLNAIQVSQEMITEESARQLELEKKKIAALEAQARAQQNLEQARADELRSTVEEVAEQDLAAELRQHFAINRERARRVQMLEQEAQLMRRRGMGGRAHQLEAQARMFRQLIDAGSGVDLRLLLEDRLHAQSIQSMEAEAQRLGRLGLFAPAEQLRDRAAELRRNMERLTSGERDPMRNLREAVDRSNTELERINGQVETIRNNVARLNE